MNLLYCMFHFLLFIQLAMFYHYTVVFIFIFITL
uniref:Uncharacterized protein n=1 Tax=Ascaris lumbricoides TaxID=6252 RepID=A0A0M3I619_ASCLU